MQTARSWPSPTKQVLPSPKGTCAFFPENLNFDGFPTLLISETAISEWVCRKNQPEGGRIGDASEKEPFVTRYPAKLSDRGPVSWLDAKTATFPVFVRKRIP